MADQDKTVVVTGEAQVNGLNVSKELSDLKARVASMEKTVKTALEASAKAAAAAQQAEQRAQLALASRPQGSRSARPKVRAVTARAVIDDEAAATVAAEGGPPEVTGDTLITVDLGLKLHSELGHGHTNLPTAEQKAALDLANLSETNRAIGLSDLDESYRLIDKFPVGYKRFNGIHTGMTSFVDITAAFSSELLSESLSSEGLVTGLRSHIRYSETQTAPFAGNFVIFGKLRQELVVLLRQPPQDNIAKLAFTVNPNVTSYIIDKPQLLAKDDYVVVPSTNKATIQRILELQRGAYFINPEFSIAETLNPDNPVYKLIPGEVFVQERSGTSWAAGGNGGLAVTRQSVHALEVGNEVYLNPGESNEELVTILSITPSGPDDLDPIDIRFTTNLAFDHDGGEPVCRADIVEIADSRTDLLLDFFSLDESGGEVPQTIIDRNIDVLMPYRYRNKNLPVGQYQTITEFLHLAEGGATGFLGLVQGMATGIFGAANQPVVHNLSLSNHGILSEQLWDASASTVGQRGIDLVAANSFSMVNTGSNTTSAFDWMAHSLVAIAPMQASGLARFMPNGQPALITHNLGLSNYFVAIEIQADTNLASIGVWGIDNVLANSFEVKHTGSNGVTPFRWTIFNTGALPRGGLLLTGLDTFPGNGTDLVITHNTNQPVYFFKITPRYSPTIAGVGAYGVHTKTLNSIKVTNGGQDSTSQFSWALFIPPD